MPARYRRVPRSGHVDLARLPGLRRTCRSTAFQITLEKDPTTPSARHHAVRHRRGQVHVLCLCVEALPTGAHPAHARVRGVDVDIRNLTIRWADALKRRRSQGRQERGVLPRASSARCVRAKFRREALEREGAQVPPPPTSPPAPPAAKPRARRGGAGPLPRRRGSLRTLPRASEDGSMKSTQGKLVSGPSSRRSSSPSSSPSQPGILPAANAAAAAGEPAGLRRRASSTSSRPSVAGGGGRRPLPNILWSAIGLLSRAPRRGGMYVLLARTSSRSRSCHLHRRRPRPDPLRRSC